MAKSKKKATEQAKPRKYKQAKLLADVVKAAGSERVVAQKLDCSQQSISAWMASTNAPRPHMQRLMLKVYNIPEPWVLQ